MSVTPRQVETVTCPILPGGDTGMGQRVRVLRVTQLARMGAEMQHWALALDAPRPRQPGAGAQVPECGWLPWKPPASPSSRGWNPRSSLTGKTSPRSPSWRCETEGTDPKSRRREARSERSYAAVRAEYVGPSLAEPHTPITAPYPHLRAYHPRLRAQHHRPEFWVLGQECLTPLSSEEAFVVLSVGDLLRGSVHQWDP